VSRRSQHSITASAYYGNRYIDQPVQTGFSYDTLVNGTLDIPTNNVTFPVKLPKQNTTLLVGTFPSNNVNMTANGTTNAARALWHFSQTFFQEFPDYKPNDNRISIWTESYGGKYGPAFTAYFQQQNEKIANGTITDKSTTYPIHLDTLGIINGCIDLLVQEPSYPLMAFNNTFGLQTINETIYKEAMEAWTQPDGCKALVEQCRDMASKLDPTNQGNSSAVDTACKDAADFCQDNIEGAYLAFSGKSYYDIAALDKGGLQISFPDSIRELTILLDPFPPPWMNGYLNQRWVQAALGVPLNFSDSVNSVFDAFNGIGDYARGGFLEDLAYILDQGIKVTMVYGDRDYVSTCITTLDRLLNELGLQLARWRGRKSCGPIQQASAVQSSWLRGSQGE
jgi:carboxypeptidase C (cathepsin A)